jgi:hypothetical protein
MTTPAESAEARERYLANKVRQAEKDRDGSRAELSHAAEALGRNMADLDAARALLGALRGDDTPWPLFSADRERRRIRRLQKAILDDLRSVAFPPTWDITRDIEQLDDSTRAPKRGKR